MAVFHGTIGWWRVSCRSRAFCRDSYLSVKARLVMTMVSVSSPLESTSASVARAF